MREVLPGSFTVGESKSIVGCVSTTMSKINAHIATKASLEWTNEGGAGGLWLVVNYTVGVGWNKGRMVSTR